MSWTEARFGKHRGKTLPEIVFHDPGYFFWAIGAGVFCDGGALETEARLIDRRARSIRVPPAVAGTLKVEYVYNRFDGRFSHLTLVPADSAPSHDDRVALRRDVIDLSLVCGARPNFKIDRDALIASLKSIVFGDASYRMTRQRCGAFFARTENFLT
jgi:hypothetical protein